MLASRGRWISPRAFFLGLLAWAVLCSSAPWAANPSKDIYRKGVRAYRAGQLAEAMELFRQSEAADASYPYPAFALGRIYQEYFNQETRHYDEAVQAYNRVALLVRANPPPPKSRALYEVFFDQGLLYLKGGEYPRAVDSLRTFLELYPEFSSLERVYNALGIAYYYLDQYDKAVEEFRRAIAIDPDYAEARFNLRSVFTRLAIYNEALALGRAGELELALDKVRHLKEFAPKYLPGRQLEAKLLYATGQTKRALRVYGEMLGLGPTDPITYQVRVDMAKILEVTGSKDEAVRLLNENLSLFPDIGDERLQREVVKLLVKLKESP